jgi:fumarate reductase subunit D
MEGERSNELSLGDILDRSDLREIRPPERPARTRQRSARRQLLRPEPLFWGLFSAGGFVAAILVPVHVAILGIAFAAGWLPDDALSYGRVADLVQNPLTKLYLLALVSLPLFHWAHRFRYAVHHQFGIHGLRRLIATLCYGTGVAGTVLTLLVLLRI